MDASDQSQAAPFIPKKPARNSLNNSANAIISTPPRPNRTTSLSASASSSPLVSSSTSASSTPLVSSSPSASSIISPTIANESSPQKPIKPIRLVGPKHPLYGAMVTKTPIRILSHYNPTKIFSYLEIYSNDTPIDYDNSNSSCNRSLSYEDAEVSSEEISTSEVNKSLRNPDIIISYLSWRVAVDATSQSQIIGTNMVSIRDIIVDRSSLIMKLLFFDCDDDVEHTISFQICERFDRASSGNNIDNDIDNSNSNSNSNNSSSSSLSSNFNKIYDLLIANLSKSRAAEHSNSYLETQISLRLEMLHQYRNYLTFSRKVEVISALLSKKFESKQNDAIRKWCKYVNFVNKGRMMADRLRWRMYALSYNNYDLQAWYHTLFYKELYRIKGGSFWFRSASFPQYRDSYKPFRIAMTPLEETQLSRILCSPNTSYGDVAGHMYVVQATASAAKTYKLFEDLCSEGREITKYPRSGLPSKKPFRFSFVGGRIYLTWHGKYGTQGVDLKTVNGVVTGAGATTILKRSPMTIGKGDGHFLSLLCDKRSVDLYFDYESDRDNIKALIELIIAKEKGHLQQLEDLYSLNDLEKVTIDDEGNASPNPNYDDDIMFEWISLYSCLGSIVLDRCPPNVLERMKQGLAPSKKRGTP